MSGSNADETQIDVVGSPNDIGAGEQPNTGAANQGGALFGKVCLRPTVTPLTKGQLARRTLPHRASWISQTRPA
jgi:hypothetical protein